MIPKNLERAPQFFFSLAMLLCFAVPGAGKRYGEQLCDHPDYQCVTVESQWVQKEVTTKSGLKVVKTPRHMSWESMFPDEREREIVMKVNRMNIRPRKGMVLAVPDDMNDKTYMDFSPFPAKMEPECEPQGEPVCSLRCVNCEEEGAEPRFKYVCEQECVPKEKLVCGPNGEAQKEKMIIFDPRLLAWAAYDERGNLANWGPAAGGKEWCGDTGRGCRTAVGTFSIQRKHNRWAVSSLYPVAKDDKPAGGAAVPYFMMFARGYGFHASPTVPGNHASHGCVRLFYDDARWLNEEFAEVGTKVIIRPY